MAQQDSKAGAGPVCLWGLPEAFSITVLSVSVVITFAPDAGGSVPDTFSMFGGGAVPTFASHSVIAQLLTAIPVLSPWDVLYCCCSHRDQGLLKASLESKDH